MEAVNPSRSAPPATPGPLPTVVIVGRPNVGKSTFFNAVTGSRRSIVGDMPGITRDRIIGLAVHNRRRFEIIDTGGIIPDDKELIPSQILKQAKVALQKAAWIVFLIDGRTEITGADRDLAMMLRKLGKPTLLAVNKIDTPKSANLVHEFASLGIQPIFPISSEHKTGIHELLDFITQEFPADPKPDPEAALATGEEEAEEDEEAANQQRRTPRQIKVAIIGRPNVGKSTLLNALTGEERAIVSPIAGTTRDAVDETVEVEGQRYVFVDTAGIRRKGKTTEMAEKLSVMMAQRHIRMANVVLLVIDASEGFVNHDASVAGYAHESGRALIVVVNKWDISKNKNRTKYEQELREGLKFLEYAQFAFISAKQGKGVEKIYAMIQEAFKWANYRVPTAELNRFAATVELEPDGKIKYITQPSVRPPTFVVFTDKRGELHFSAERQLINRLRKHFGFKGTPLVIKARNSSREREKK